MANVTIALPDETLRLARLRALEQGTSVNALVREYLEAFSSRDAVRAALSELVSLARRSRSSSGINGRSWTREDLHER